MRRHRYKYQKTNDKYSNMILFSYYTPFKNNLIICFEIILFFKQNLSNFMNKYRNNDYFKWS